MAKKAVTLRLGAELKEKIRTAQNVLTERAAEGGAPHTFTQAETVRYLLVLGLNKSHLDDQADIQTERPQIGGKLCSQ